MNPLMGEGGGPLGSGVQHNFMIFLSVSAFINPSKVPEIGPKQKISLPSLTPAVPLVDF